MKTMLKIFFLLAAGFLLLIPGASHVAGCGSGASAPPASIPAPVSSLITVSPPDPDTGVVFISGGPDSVEPNATVLAANVTLGGVISRLWDLVIRSAHAQLAVNAVADDTGQFFLEILGNSGDEIEIVQEVGGEKSEPTLVTVP